MVRGAAMSIEKADRGYSLKELVSKSQGIRL